MHGSWRDRSEELDLMSPPEANSVGAIVQARMSSTRLPGKVLLPIENEPMLHWVTMRMELADRVDKLLVACSTNGADDPIARFCRKRKIPCFRGPEDDVLKRFHDAQRTHGLETIVRITGDCPLHDPEVIDRVTEQFLKTDCDYASNVRPPTFPDGLDTEVFSRETLEWLDRTAETPEAREHITYLLHDPPANMRTINVEQEVDRSDQRWTVDRPEDLRFVRSVYRRLSDKTAGMKRILELLEENPELTSINKDIPRNEKL